METLLTAEDLVLLQNLEESMWQEETRYNLEFQQERFAEDFFEFGSSGKIWQREESIMQNGEAINCRIPLEGLNIRLLAKDVAQITYNSIVDAPKGLGKSHRSSIWTRIEGVWKMRFHQGTPFK